MAESTEPTPQQPEEMYWALTLRTDLQDIRNEIRGLHTRIDSNNGATNSRIDSNSAATNSRIDSNSAATNSRIDSIHKRFDEAAATTNTRFEALSRRLDSQFRWMIMAMIGMTGLLAALIKL